MMSPVLARGISSVSKCITSCTSWACPADSERPLRLPGLMVDLDLPTAPQLCLLADFLDELAYVLHSCKI